MFLMFVFGLIGLFVRGFPGLVVGATLGFVLSRVFRSLVLRGLRSIQNEFLESTFSVVGALCKADGVVTRDEIQFAEGLFDRFHLSGEGREAAKAAFARGKSPDFDLEAAVDKFARSVRSTGPLVQLFLQIQLLAVTADGQIHPKEHEMLVRIARRLGLSAADVERLEALLRAAASGEAVPNGPPPRERLADAYTALGVSSEANDDEVKRAYRKLIIENHPDKLASKGLPENMREFAEERARQVNAAYDVIKRARGIA